MAPGLTTCFPKGNWVGGCSETSPLTAQCDIQHRELLSKKPAKHFGDLGSILHFPLASQFPATLSLSQHDRKLLGLWTFSVLIQCPTLQDPKFLSGSLATTAHKGYHMVFLRKVLCREDKYKKMKSDLKGIASTISLESKEKK